MLDIAEIERYRQLVQTGGDEEVGLLALMPKLSEWNHIIRGDLHKDGPFDMLYPCSPEQRDRGAAFLLRRQSEFREADEGN